MTKEELETATTIHSKMLQYKKISRFLKDAIEDNKITSIRFLVSSGLPIEFAHNGLDFHLLLVKIQEELERLYKENKEEFKEL